MGLIQAGIHDAASRVMLLMLMPMMSCDVILLMMPRVLQPLNIKTPATRMSMGLDVSGCVA